MKATILVLARVLDLLLMPFSAASAMSAQSANRLRRQSFFRLPYGDPARDWLADEIHQSEERSRRPGLAARAERWLGGRP